MSSQQEVISGHQQQLIEDMWKSNKGLHTQLEMEKKRQQRDDALSEHKNEIQRQHQEKLHKHSIDHNSESTSYG